MTSPCAILDGWRDQLADHVAGPGLHVGIPKAPPLSPAAVVRWAWRSLHGRRPRLFHIRPAPDLEQRLHSFRSGDWVHLVDEHAPTTARTLVSLGVHVLDDSLDGVVPALPDAWCHQQSRIDLEHLAASDPTLEAARHALLAHARAAGTVLLVGETGTERASLVRWCQAMLGEHTALRTHPEPPRAGAWSLYPDIDLPGFDSPLAAVQQELASRGRMTPVTRTGTRPKHPCFDAILGESRSLTDAMDAVVELAPTSLPVLVHGEPGVGKERIARAVHKLSGRAGPFLAIDMGALPEGVAESSLFGHVEGAFTGATGASEGLLRRARGGTVFLDEVGNLSLSTQRALLRVLQAREVLPIGGDTPLPIDVRIVSATNADLDLLVAQGTFRADLRDRLQGARIEVPPLRERGADVHLLATAFLHRERPEATWTPDALERLAAHTWPGNIRELEHTVIRASARARGNTLDVATLPELASSGPTPIFLLAAQAERPAHISPTLWNRLAAVTVRIPPLRERGPQAIAYRVRHLLGDHDIRDDAALALARHPWWGNGPDLNATIAALRALQGPITAAVVRPLLSSRGGAHAAPMHVVLFAIPHDDGVRGFEQRHDASSLLIGRYAHSHELTGPSALGDRRLASWQRLVHARAGGVPACLDISFAPGASRAQALVVRGADGLVVHAFEGTALTVQVSSLEGPPIPASVVPGREVPVGRGARLELIAPDGSVSLSLLLFDSDVARSDLAAEASRRTARRRSDPTHAPTHAPNRPAVVSKSHRRRVWVLSEAEQHALVEVLATHPGGSLSTWVRAEAERWSTRSELQRLRTWLAQAPRVSQYLARMTQLPGNRRLRDALSERRPPQGYPPAIERALSES